MTNMGISWSKPLKTSIAPWLSVSQATEAVNNHWEIGRPLRETDEAVKR